MRLRRPQPPIDPAVRAAAEPPPAFWPAASLLLLALAALAYGAHRTTAIPRKDGGFASEPQLVRAFALSGLQFPGQTLAPPPTPRLDDPAGTAEELARWAQQQAAEEAATPGWVVRIDPRAATRCPT